MTIQLPQVTVVGTLTADPELRFTQSGTPVVSVSIASNSRRYNRDTKQYEDGDTVFLRANIWNEQAENVNDSLTKGQRVIATGVLKQKTWEDRSGGKRSSLELEVDEIGPALRFSTAKVSKRGETVAASTSSDGWGAQDSIPGW